MGNPRLHTFHTLKQNIMGPHELHSNFYKESCVPIMSIQRGIVRGTLRVKQLQHSYEQKHNIHQLCLMGFHLRGLPKDVYVHSDGLA